MSKTVQVIVFFTIMLAIFLLNPLVQILFTKISESYSRYYAFILDYFGYVKKIKRYDPIFDKTYYTLEKKEAR